MLVGGMVVVLVVALAPWLIPNVLAPPQTRRHYGSLPQKGIQFDMMIEIRFGLLAEES